MSGQRVVVTGGAGFIGSHLADALVARGDDVVVVDDLSNGRHEQVPAAAAFHQLDIANVDELSAFAREHGPFHRWYHLAAQADVRVSVDDPALDARANVIGTISVVRAAREHGALVAFASTGGAIYGDVDVPADESFPERPTSPYGAAKLASEIYLAQDARLSGASHVALRFSNVYGPRQDPHGEAGVVAIFAGLVRNGRPARVYGDGLQTRDHVFVQDVVQAVIAAADAAATGDDGELRDGGGLVPVYNVGTGTATSVLDLWTAMQRVCGAELGVEHHPERAGEVRTSVLDASRIRTRLGVALDTPLADGLRATVDALAASATA